MTELQNENARPCCCFAGRGGISGVVSVLAAWPVWGSFSAARRLTDMARVGVIVALAGGFFSGQPFCRANSVAGAGLNNFQQTAAPNTLTADVSLSAGREFSLALKRDGTVIGWGHPGEGRATPPADLSGVIALSAGIYHTVALKADGTVTGWGFGGNALLDVPANLSNVVAVAAGGYHSLALQRDGTVVAWGFNGNGRTTPPEDLRDVVAIDAGRDHSVALKSDGTVVAWGLNDEGQTNVPAGLTNVVAISAGDNHTLALKEDGTVVAWGQNDSRQATVPAGLTGVVAIAAGARHSLVLKSNGAVQGWGDNTNGQLNLTGTNIRGVAAGGYHSLVTRSAGPLITKQPRSRASLSGQSVTLSAEAIGSGLTYQWQFNGRDIAGATGATLTLTGINRSHAGVYTVRISSKDGTVVSQNSVITVRGRLKPAPPQRLANGAMRLSFSDEFGDPLTAVALNRYQVEVSEDLRTWVPMGRQCTLNSGRMQVEDVDAGRFARRFYRVIEK